MGVETLNCKCCGAALKTEDNVCECEYCGAVNVITGDTGKYINQLNRANKLRQGKEFDRALNIYDDILADNPPSADLLWERTLCEYGIEYVQDPVSNRYIPTLHRIKDESILNYYSYLEALEIADPDQKSIIEKEANEIAKIQNEYLDIVRKEKPYDVFICYKETDDVTKLQTEDSGLALDLYERLVDYGFKVFFARVTLQDKIGVNYEPYIFGALNSAKVMVVVGTKPEYFTSVWVKNEWSRFLKLMEKDKKKQMFFACDYVDDLPKAFNGRQAQLLNQPNAIQNLAFVVKRCLEQLNESASQPAENVKKEEAQTEQKRAAENNTQKSNTQQTQGINTATYNYGYGDSGKKKNKAALPVLIITILLLICCPCCGSCMKYVIDNTTGSTDSQSMRIDDSSNEIVKINP